MKKNLTLHYFLRRRKLIKLLEIMRISLLLIVIGIFQVSASVYSQNKKITIKDSDLTMREVFKEIENQSNFRFFYNDVLTNIDKRVELTADQLNIKDLLDGLLNGTNLSYKILENDLIIISPKVLLQQIKVMGTITDAGTGEAIPGANVVVEGTTLGVTTDLDGKYSLELPSPNSTLVISYIGYNTEKIEVNGRTQVDVTLIPDVKKLDEIVVIGYGTAKKSDLSGASVSVSGDKLKTTISANLDQALQGRAAGVTAIQTSGQPGAGVSIRIRGQGTLSASAAEPLYVIDGVPVQNVSQSGSSLGLGDRLGNGSVSPVSGLSSVNPSDILSMEILKDASATAIYGSRGANGVVLITTKRGKAGDAKFSYEFNYGIQEQAKRIDVMNLREFAEFSNDYAAETDGREPRVELMDPELLGEGTNWQDAVFRKAPLQSHQISATGGTEKARYFVSGSYYSQEGTVIGSEFNRFTGRVNLDADLKPWFKLGTNMMFSRSDERLGLNNSDEGIISIALRSAPDVPIYNTDGTFSGDEREGSAGTINPIGKAMDEELLLKRTNFTGNIYADLTLFKGLTWHAEANGDLGGSNAYTFLPTYQYGNVKNTSNTSAHQTNQNLFWQLKNYVTYTKQIAKHNVSAMVGQEVSESQWEYLRGSSSGLSSNEIHQPSLGTQTTMAIGSGKGSGAMASFFGRGTYAFNEKYFATYTYRRDGSSNFGPKNRWAPFHSFSVSWRLSNEAFMQGIKGVVSNLKIRAGWGQTGNANIGGYLWGSSISKMATGLGQGFRQNNIANPYIMWEKQEQVNLGVDLGLFDNRIELVVDLYDKTSSDMLMSMELPSYMGTSGNGSIRLNPPMGNFGKIQNKGIEISLSTHPFRGNFSWDNEFQITVNKNKLLGLTGTPAAHIEGYGQWTDLVSLTNIGDPLYNFYGYKVVGIYQDKQDILNSPKPKKYPTDGNFNRDNTVWPGDLKFADLSGPDGVPDGIIDEYDRTNIGSPLPKFTFGFNNTFRYKNLELVIFINGTYGNKVMNYVGRSLSAMTSMWGNQLETVVDRAKLEPIDPNKVYTGTDAWYKDIDNVRVANPGGDMPRAIGGDPNTNTRISDRYIEDGSFLRFKNISLAYNFPKNILAKTKLDGLRVYANVQNMWTITKYTGFDPEIGASQTSNNVYGLDNGRYPSPRIYTFGVNISF